MARITDALDRSLRSVRSVRSIHRHRTRPVRTLPWGLCAVALAVVGLSCGELDPTAESSDPNASLSSKPGRVDDLRVLDVSDTSVTLVWTEVDNGLGTAADYQVRYAASPIGWGWGSATVVSSGTCASPIDGVAIGSTLECTVEGLDPETMYDFQVVAFRGTLNEDAVFGDLSNVATGTTEAPHGPPAQVTDLAVSDMSESGATLRFTEVDDGAGEPASYQVRYAPSPIGYGWGSATVVTEGSCTSPVAGTAIDSTLTCTVGGLAASTDYDFQLVAFRGTLNEDAVFGELSNVASGTTEAAAAAGAPEQVTDLAVVAASDTSATLRFTEVDNGAGEPADYEIRYAPPPIGDGWGSATVVSAGSCASPVAGTAIDSTLTCTVEGLTASTDYDFQLVGFRGTLNEDAVFGPLSNVATGSTAAPPATNAPEGCADGVPEWIWCDDFEEDRLASYFEYDDAGGSFVRAAGVGLDGSQGMRVRWAAGQVSAGALHLAFGRTPQAYFAPVDAGTADYREVYWRMYVRNAPDWVGGGGDKLSRATIFGSSTSWAQAMIAHVWSGSSPDQNYLVLDPASGTDEEGNLLTTTYNDFANLRWLGAVRGATPLFDGAHVGTWHCVEARVRLNDAGSANGVFELWVDGELDARRTDLNWIGSYDDYGINAIFFENYWNAGSPADQERYFDDIVVSTAPIGCDSPAPAPTEPQPDVASLSVTPAADTINAIGYGTQLTASAVDANGDPIADPDLAWASLDTAIATVDAAGYVISRATGTVLITATAVCCATSADTARIDVGQVVASVEVTPSSSVLPAGDTVRLAATALDSAGTTVPGGSFDWSSSDGTIATVDASGLVTALADGTVNIMATSSGKTGTGSVSVEPEPAPTDPEPVYDPASDVALWSDDFDDYLDTSDLLDAYVTNANHLITLDALGGVGGGGAARMDWLGNEGTTSCSDKDQLLEKSFSATSTLFLSFSVRYSPDFVWNWANHDPCWGMAKKMFFFWERSAGARFIFVAENGTLAVGFDGVQEPLLRQNVGTATTLAEIGDGSWHRFTFEIRQESSSGAGDGMIRGWIDGRLAWSFTGLASGGSSGFNLFKTPTTFNHGSPVTQAEWLDGLHIWRD